MNLRSVIPTVDVHVAGQVVRILQAYDWSVSAPTMPEKRKLLAGDLARLRRRVLIQPRGDLTLRGAVVTGPASKEARAGILFLDAHGEPDFDAYTVLGVARWVLTQQPPEGKTAAVSMVFDTCAGPVTVSADMAEGGGAGEVSVLMPPCSVALPGAKVSVPSMGTVRVDIVRMIDWYALINEEEWRTTIEMRNFRKLLTRTIFLRYMVNKELTTGDPKPLLDGRVCYVAHIGQKLSDTRGEKIFGSYDTNRYDIAPSIPGLCGRMAILHGEGALAPGDWFTAEGIIGTRISGRIAKPGNASGMVIEIKAKPHLVGFAQWVLENGDPVADGFLVDPPEQVTW